MCYQLVSSNLLNPEFECSPAKTPTINLNSSPESLAYSIQVALPSINDDTRVFNPKWVKTNGNYYSTNNSFIIRIYR